MINNSYLDRFEKLTIVGGGETGRAVVETLSESGVELFLTDNGRIPGRTRATLDRENVEYEEGHHTKDALKSDLLVVSPGVPPESNLLQEARSLGVPVIGEIELGDRLSPAERTVAVTGTNGKTTTVKLISALLNRTGENPVSCGNIGRPYIEAVKSLNSSDVPIVEVSSYQLQYVENFRPEIAVLLNIEPDHLKRHGTFEAYREAKLKIFRNQKQGDCALINQNIDLPEGIPGSSRRIEFSRREVPGVKAAPHQMENIGAAAGVVECILGEKLNEIPANAIKPALRVPHRLEKVGKIGKITAINDSKATNPSATLAALDSLERPVNLLLGGRKKKGGYRELVRSLDDREVRRVYLFGSGREELNQLLEEEGFEQVRAFESMEEATKSAFSAAHPGEIVLLSPACSSFDAFSNFEERGDAFRGIISKLI